MPLLIEKVTSRVSIEDRQLPLTQAQIDQLVTLVLTRLDERAREGLRAHAATHVRHSAEPPLGTER